MTRRTKIVVTIGPSTWNPEVLSRVVRAGADAFRVNFSHGDPSIWSKIVRVARETDKEAVRPLVGDLQGPVVRLGKVGEIPVAKGDKLTLALTEEGDPEKRLVPLPERSVFEIVEEGDVLLIESGRIALRADEVKGDSVLCTALIDGVIRGGKTFAIKSKDLPLPALTDRDVDAVRFAVENGFDYISLSFVKTSKDVDKLKHLLRDLGASHVKVVAKIETRSAVENLEEIVEAADAVLVARGDLAIYFDLEEMPKVQRRIVNAARAQGKPVIVATQLLDSMVNNPVPTRSEVVDVYRAVSDGADALLLTNETAVGKYPVESVAWLSRIIEEAEKGITWETVAKPQTLYEAVAKAAVTIADLLGGKIIAYSAKGSTAKRLAMYRPKSEVHVFSRNPAAVRQMNLLWGIKPHLSRIDKKDPNLFDRLMEEAKNRGILAYGDIAILTAGIREGATDMIRVERTINAKE